MKRLFLAALLLAVPLEAQPNYTTARSHVDSLEARLAWLETIVGTKDALVTNAEWRIRGRPPEAFAGNYSNQYRIFQFGEAFTGLVGESGAIPAIFSKLPPAGRTVPEYVASAIAAAVVAPSPAPAPAPPPPASSSCTLAPLSSAQIDALAVALNRGIGHFGLTQAIANKIVSDARAGRYAYVDLSVLGPVKGWFYDGAGGVTPADQAAINPYLTIIDQRVPGTDDLLPVGDPRIKCVSGSVVIVPPPAPPPASGGGGAISLPGLGTGIVMPHGYPGKPNLKSIFFSGGDGGSRWLTNQESQWPCLNLLCSSDPTLPQGRLEWEQDGAWSFGYTRPANTAAGDWDGKPGKPVLIRPGGVGSGGQVGSTASLYGGWVGRDLALGVARSQPNVVDDGKYDIRISAADATNPISITLGGAQRKLVPCGQQVCWQ